MKVPKKYVTKVRSLGLLEQDEQIKYFYSDALFSIENGMYFVTDKHLVLYCSEWEEPETIVRFKDISYIEVEYDESFLTDSFVTIETVDGLEVSFPVSSEKGRDKKFVEYIQKQMKAEP